MKPIDIARGEEGSLPLVLLAAIILAGVITALFTVVSTGTDTAQRDRDVAQAFQVADAGLQEAYVDLLNVDLDALDSSDPGHATAPCANPAAGSNVGSGECSRELPNGGEVVWEYEQIGDTRQWIVVSRGNFLRSDQVVRAQVGQSPLFNATLTSLDSINLNGLGTALTGSTCNIPQFAMGAAGQISINGQGGNCISGITLYDGAPAPNLGAGGGDIEVTESGTELVVPDLAGEAFGDGTTCDENDLDTIPASGVIPGGSVWCVGSLTVQNLDITGDEEVVIYVQNEVKPATFATWNINGDAEQLRIYVAGAQGFELGPNRRVHAGIVAPNGPCVTSGFGSVGYFQGAMACGTITVNGNFDYDATVFDIFEGDFGVSLFSQEARDFES